MKNYIWDLDGTLIDSYESITKSLYETLDYFNISYDKDYVYQFIKKYSCKEYILKVTKENNIDSKEFKTYYSSISSIYYDQIKLIDHANDILRYIVDSGNRNFIVTHRGISTIEILKKLNIYDLFTEIITTENGFPRKPDPTSINYLKDKYNMNNNETYYIGDRELDINCAINSNILSILYYSKDSNYPVNINPTYKVDDLIKIKDIQ